MKSLQPGDPVRIGGYRLLGRLGAGGMGEVFFGRSAGGRPVAVKVIRSEHAGDPQFRERFAREIEAARRVGGFHTAPVVDADPTADPPWMVTAYVAGPSLHDAVARHGPLPADALRTLGAGLSEGLGAIHACGLIHRDLKPGNVLLADDGPRIIDFGIARATDAGAAMTTAGAILGTYLFMSPEQTYGRQAGPASDVFSLGGVLAFAGTGASPFDGDSLPAVIYRITSEEPDLSRVPTEFGLRELVAACLSKDPADRPSVTDVLSRLGDTAPGDGWPPATVLDVPPGPVPTVSPSAGAGPAPEPVRGAAPGGPGLHQQPTAASPPRASRPAPPGAPGVPAPSSERAARPRATARSGPPVRSGSAPVSSRRRALLTLGAVTVAAAVGVPLALNLTGDEDDGSLPFSAPDSEGGVNDVAVSPNGRILAGRCDEFVQLWDTRTRQSLGKLPASNLSWGHTPAFSRDSGMVAAGTDDGTVHLWSTTTRRSLAVFEGKDKWRIQSVGISPDGNRVYGNDGNVVWVWNRLDKQPSGNLRPTGPTGMELKCSALAPDGKILAVACGNGTVPLMSTATRRVTDVIHGESVITQLAFSPDGKILAGTGDRDETVLLWDVPHAGDKNPVIGSLTHTHASPTALAFGSGGKTLAVAYDDNTIRLWNVGSRRVTKTITLSSDEAATEGLAFSTDGAFLAVTRGGGGHLWDLR